LLSHSPLNCFQAAEEREKEDLKKQEEERIRMENILSGNPLLREKYASSAAGEKSDMKVKRRWDDDVVFKNCSRAEPDKKVKTYVNDSLRSEFHRKFMDKYIQ
jgi:protein CWC15